MKTTSIIATIRPEALLSLTVGEVTTHTVEAAKEFASFQERGCKYLGLLRGRLGQLGVSSADTFKLIVSTLTKAGLDEKRAKSAVNNGNGHAALASLLLREDGGVAIDSDRFYAVSVRDAKAVATSLKRGGDDAIRAFNKLRLKDGKLSKKGLAAFLPKEEETNSEAVESETSEAEESETSEAVETTPRQAVAKAIATLTKLLPKLDTNDRDAALSALATLIG